MADYEYILTGDGSLSSYLDSDGYVVGHRFDVYADLAPSTVNFFLNSDLIGKGYTYFATGYGPADPSGYTDTFNFYIQPGWTTTYSYEADSYGNGFRLTVYDELGYQVTEFTVVGGALGTIGVHCFTKGALIGTPDGQRRIEELSQGDLVLTRDRGAQPVRWIGSSKLTSEALAQYPDLRPVRIAADTFGGNREQLVSPAHRMLVDGWRAEALFGEAEVLASARSLVNGTSIAVAHDVESVEYYHILFDRHELVQADGAWSESFHPSGIDDSTSQATRDEVLAIFPDIEVRAAAEPVARPALQADAVRILMD